MRDAFREWYRPDSDDLRSLWERALIVLDANVLLGLYRYPPDVFADVVRVLDQLREQLWMPYQVGLEFHRNRDDRLPEQRQVLERVARELDDLVATAERLSIPDYHPVLDLTESEIRRENIRTAIDHLADFVREAADATPAPDPVDTATDDPVLAAVTQLYEGRVGLPMSAEETRAAEKEALERYQRCVPPGYKDTQKEAPRKYNDYFIWKELLANAAAGEPRRPCIFVTNDRKEDWWRRRRELLVGPRTELIREYFDATGEAFWMYTPEVFLQHAQRFRIEDLATTTIDAVRTASEASTVARVLRSQRMVLPDLAVRLSALDRLYEDVRAGRLRVAGDVHDAIGDLGDMFQPSSMRLPLFFGLINETYGPIRIVPDATKRLRDRRIDSVIGSESHDEFVSRAHAGWLAQALYRVRLEPFGMDELLTGLFGADPPAWAPPLLREAREVSERDAAIRGAD